MSSIKNASVFVFFAVTLAAIQFWGVEVRAQSSYFTSMGCVDCHTPTATCNGCHAHGTHASSAKTGINITGVTNKAVYAAGETVSVTIAGGYRTGWVRAVLLDQNQNELARSGGNDSGMGSSTTFPAVLTAPAPVAPGTYSWKVAWYGNDYDKSGATFGSQWVPDPNNPNHGMEMANVASFTVGSPADTAAPVVSAFTLPATATSLSIPVSSFSATDNVAVTGYLVNTSATAPAASAAGWSATAPATVTAAAAGSTTFFAWAKDAAGNVSLAKSAAVVVTLPDTAAPVVSAFTLPATATSLSIPVSSFSATDNVAVTGYLVNTSATAPAASAAGWSATAPATVTAAAAGSTTFFAWAKDAAGNVSLAKSAAVVVTLPDTAVPVVSAFTLPATATSLTIAVGAFSATDNVAVTGYLVNTSATAPAASAAGWSATAPATVTAAAAGSTTFFAWAKDAAGNVSLAKSAAVVVTLPDTAVPVVSAFTLPATATSLTIAVGTFSATDNVAVTGYLINTSATAPAASAAGWSATAPATVTAAAAGSTTFFAWAKDAAGNVSLAKSAAVVVTLADTTVPVVSTFTLPATATSLTIAVSSFSASDNVAVTGYLVNTSVTAPAASAAGWSATAPATVTAAAAGSTTFFAWAKDAAGNVSLAKSAAVVVTLPDTAAPVVSAFTLPATATSLTIAVGSFSATDNVAVTGYLVNTSATAPAASAAGWSATAPATVTAAAAGSTTFFAWAKDAAGNVSLGKSAAVVVTLADTSAPVVSAFTLPATATNLTIAVGSLSATDNVAVTGYLVSTSATAPAASATGWTAASPATVIASSAGSTTFYAWAKDAAGNVSLAKSATVVVTLPDTIAPVVLTFTLPATATSTTVPVSALSASDNVAVTGYQISISAAAPAASAAGWSATAPATVTAAATGSTTFYAWAKDAAGNVSLAKSATVTVASAADTTKPALTISALANGAYTNKMTLNLTGSATDAGGLKSVTVNGGAIAVNTDGSFSTALALVVGPNTITVIATDNAGNQQVDTRTVTYDPAAPVLTVSSPADNSSSSQTLVTVTGSVNESSTVAVSVNNGSLQYATVSGTSFTAAVYLVAGTNTIDITATDLAGNTTSSKRTVTYASTQQLTLAVTYPVQDITTRQSTLILKGTVADAGNDVAVKIVMNGRTFTPRVYKGEFQQQLNFPIPKLYTITVIAKDQAGNTSTILRNVIYRPSRSNDDGHDED